ncbi:MAG: FecR domain-containing protein [Kiritimatiellae bacterium]|nr:FecR domain-containing protein [Kiritimatiellia bacterium]
MSDERLDILIGKYLEDDCVEEEAQALLAQLGQSEEARLRFARHVYHEKTLVDLLAAPARVTAEVIPYETEPARVEGADAGSRRRRIQAAALIAASVLIAMLGAWLWRVPRAAPDMLARVRAPSGTVVVARGAAQRSAVPEMALAAGDVLRTGARGRVTVAYPDGSSLCLRPETEVVLGVTAEAIVRMQNVLAPAAAASPPVPDVLRGADSAVGHVFVREGGVVAKLARRPASVASVLLATPNAVVEVVGTTLELSVAPYWTRVDVTQGRARLTRLRDGRRAELAAGQYAVVAAGLALSARPIAAPRSDAGRFAKRYVICRADLTDRADVEALEALVERAAAVGYNGLIIGDFGGRYVRLENMTPGVFSSFIRIREAAAQLGLALIPCSIDPTQVSYENPSLVETVPVRDTPFSVESGLARVEGPGPLRLRNGGFEDGPGPQPVHWRVTGAGSARVERDATMKRTGAASLALRPAVPGGGAAGKELFIEQVVAVEPFRAYELSAWVQPPAEHAGELRMLIEGGRRGLLGGVIPRLAGSGWRRVAVAFNALESTAVRVRLGVSRGTGSGTYRLDDFALREVGLRATVRRASLPVVVRAADGAVTFSEGSDYVVEEEQLRLPPGSRIGEGTHLLVSWYVRPEMFGGPGPACAGYPAYFTHHADNARRLDTLFGAPPAFMMGYRGGPSGWGGWYVGNWDPICGDVPAGVYVAETLRRSEELLRDINPGYELYLSNDMVDPYACAKATHFLMRGSLEGAWEGVSRRTVIVNRGRSKESLLFFARRGHRQLVACAARASAVDGCLRVLDEAEPEGVIDVVGFVFGLGDDRPPALLRGMDLEIAANRIRTAGRWGHGPAFGRAQARRSVGPLDL